MNETSLTTTVPPHLEYRQPKGLYVLFSTELWERFGFYTVQTILILYLTKGLLFSDHDANLLYAAFAALLYLTPTFGGYIADKYLGFQKAIIIGGILFMLGYFLMATHQHILFFLGLSILIAANGFFKPNVSSIVGTLYRDDDPRRDSGFTLFYMGINIGAVIPPLFSGTLVEHYGWHAGFFTAALGMIICLFTFIIGKRRFDNKGLAPADSPLNKDQLARQKFYFLFAVGLVVAVACFYLALSFPETTSILVVIAAVVFVGFIIFSMLGEAKAARHKMYASLVLMVISVAFWALYNQTFTSLTLFADRNMVPYIWGFRVDAEFMQGFNPFFIIILSPLVSKLWIYLGKRNLTLSFPMKFSLGVLLVSLGFLVLGLGTQFFAHAAVVSPWWLVMGYFLQTSGELLLSPIGLSMITVLSPKHMVGMMMGVWFFSISSGYAAAGYLANLAAVPEHTSKIASLAIYNHAFWLFGGVSLVLSLLTFFLIPSLKRMIGTVGA
jgi:POT family proton-dependent oligopeptide transporter